MARCLLRRDAPVDRPSRVFGLRPEDQRRWLHTPSGLREPSASNPKVVSPTNLNELALREKKLVDEAERAIQQLNQLGLGEEISHDQYLAYLERLPCPSAYFNTSDELHGTQLVDHEIRLALYRLKYAKVMSTILFALTFHPDQSLQSCVSHFFANLRFVLNNIIAGSR